VVSYGLHCDDEFTRRVMSPGLRAAAKAYPAVYAKWATSPRVQCAAWPQSDRCEVEFIPDASQRRAIKKFGSCAELACRACQREAECVT
jgi:hypothetical protein